VRAAANTPALEPARMMHRPGLRRRQLLLLHGALLVLGAAALAAGDEATPEPEPPDPCAIKTCPGHSTCTPRTGVCRCEQGYTGAACDPVSCGALPNVPAHTTTAGCDAPLSYTETCTAHCIDGWEGGPLKITCQADGSYSDTTSPCKRSTCAAGQPEESHNVNDCAEGQFEDTCTAQCSEGYVYSSGEREYKCDVHGKWSGGGIRCDPKPCGPSPTPAHTTGCGQERHYPQTCTARCIAGYEGDSLDIRCQADGTYSDATSPCNPIVCPAAPPVGAQPDGTAQDCKAGHFDDAGCQAQCIAGYDATGERHYKCDTSGAWSVDGSLVCQGKPCTGAPEGGGAQKSETKAGEPGHFPSTLTFSCPSGKKVAGDDTWLCDSTTLEYRPAASDAVASDVKCLGCPTDQGTTKNAADLQHCSVGKLTCPVHKKPDDCCKAWNHCPLNIGHGGIKKCHDEFTTRCTECEPGYTVGQPDTCRAQDCPALPTDPNGRVTLTNAAKTTFSGTKATPTTTMKWTCNQGYILTYSSSFVAQSLQDTWTCGVNSRGRTVWVDPIRKNTEQPLTARCVQTCAATMESGTRLPNDGPCSKKSNIDPGDVRHSACYDNGGKQKFRCTCRAGWRGERCDDDIDECSDNEYKGHCESRETNCAASDTGLPEGCTTTGYTLEAPLECASPYWLDSTTKLPSGCDRDHSTTTGLITRCTNWPGSWTCGSCTDSPSCCQRSQTTQPAISLGRTPWHRESSYRMCDVKPLNSTAAEVDSHLCPAHPWQEPGCTGAAGPNSVMKLEHTTACTTVDRLCSCGGVTRQYVSAYCAQADDTFTLIINPRDAHGRLSAENSLTENATFAIELIGQAETESQTACVLPPFLHPLQWDESLHYIGTWKCQVAGQYTLHVRTDGHDVQGSPQEIQVLPNEAVPERTLAQFAEPGWCVSDNGGRPRCRTMNGISHRVLVKIRDRYANERRKHTISNGKLLPEPPDTVEWSWEVTRSKLRMQKHVAVWSQQYGAYAFNFTVDDTLDAQEFNLNISVNGNESWTPAHESRHRPPSTPDYNPSLWGYTRVVYAVWLGATFNATDCAALDCDALSTLSANSEPGATTDSPSWETWSKNLDKCERAGCFFSSGEEGNPVELQLDWLPQSHVKVTFVLYCLEETEKVYGNQYWQGQCDQNVAWNDIENGKNATVLTSDKVKSRGLQFRHPGLYELTVEVTSTATPTQLGINGSIPLIPISWHGNWRPDHQSGTHTPPVLLHVAPGVPSNLTSSMYVHLDHPQPTSGTTWSSLSRGQLDGLLGGQGYGFRVESRDSLSNPRGYLTNEVVIEIKHVDKSELPDSVREFQPLDAFSSTSMTAGLKALATSRGTSQRLNSIPYSMADDIGVLKFTSDLKSLLNRERTNIFVEFVD
jgi:hypothetical protein